MKIPRELRDLAREYERRGWTITLGGSGHLKWRSPAGALVVTAASPGHRHALEITRADLRRAERRTSP
jgi:hypothetical protein